MLTVGQAVSSEPIKVGYRSLDVVQASQSVLWCRYADLCEQPFAAMDFMALCDTFSAILNGFKLFLRFYTGYQQVAAKLRVLTRREVLLHMSRTRMFVAAVVHFGLSSLIVESVQVIEWCLRSVRPQHLEVLRHRLDMVSAYLVRNAASATTSSSSAYPVVSS